MKEMFVHYKLPKPLVTIGRSKVHATEESFFQIAKQLSIYKEILFLTKSYHREYWEPQNPLKSVIQKVGWGRYCREIFWVYLQKSLSGEFPKSISGSFSSYEQKIEELESRFKNIETTAAKRVFLLYCYLELTALESDHQFFDIDMIETLGAISDQARNKNGLPDWYLITLYHIMMYLGEDAAFNLVSGDQSYSKLYGVLNTEQRREMTENLLAYGYSINDYGPFKRRIGNG